MSGLCGDILAAYAGDPADGPARRTVNLMAHLLGVFARELVFQYLPFGGIHFAGSAARGILGSAARDLFLSGLEVPGRFSEQIAGVPIRLITDDAAALTGAARYFESADRFA
ncbi:glucokinase [Sedimentitalea sp. JM2-8]|uniref:Glucokinase n=1 Tax=Sedimentitalea xiamensis TaxID=3050037 RepID=A0ABT7FAZ7_9RHOB|nr:glucokinase [Sedimentitalea xiamensis]MDK3072294.1 glucokinase [Sedimentitalea xiamensis]